MKYSQNILKKTENGVMHLKMNANILVILHSELTVHILNMIWIIRN